MATRNADIDDQGYILVTDGNIRVELPLTENYLSQETLKTYFINGTGLGFPSNTGCLRCLPVQEGKILPPPGGWAGTDYHIVQNEKPQVQSSSYVSKDSRAIAIEKAIAEVKKVASGSKLKGCINKKVISKSPPRKIRKQNYKIHIGWLHGEKNCIRQVRSCEGGSLRFIEVDDLTSVTVEMLVERGKEIFYPQGISQKGKATDMKFSLGNFSKIKIEDFVDRDGHSCTFSTYLKDNGLYLSRFNMYLISECSDDDSKEDCDSIRNIIVPELSPEISMIEESSSLDSSDSVKPQSTFSGSLKSQSVCSENVSQKSPTQLPLQNEGKVEKASDLESSGSMKILDTLSKVVLQKSPAICSVEKKIKDKEISINKLPLNDTVKVKEASSSDSNMVSLDVLSTRYINMTCPDRKPEIEITYFQEIHSSFSEVITCYSTTSLENVVEACCLNNPEVREEEVFDPFDYDFRVKRIRVDRKFYLDTDQNDEERHFVFPQSKTTDSLILHHPYETWGYDIDDNLILAVVASCHGCESAWYTWYRNDKEIKSGPHQYCIVIKECGIYHVKVSFRDFFDMSQTIAVGLLHSTKSAAY